MEIWQIKEISSDAFLSFSDDLKLKMIRQQFAFPMEHHDEVREWLIDNTNSPYMIDKLKSSEKHTWIKFVDEEDAMAFKLRWS